MNLYYNVQLWIQTGKILNTWFAAVCHNARELVLFVDKPLEPLLGWQVNCVWFCPCSPSIPLLPSVLLMP